MRKELAAISIILASGAALAEEGYSAKSLFFGEDGTVQSASTAPSTPPTGLAAAPKVAKPVVQAKAKSRKTAYLGASYFVRLMNKDGSTRDVLTSHAFKSGDRFQLAVKVNKPSYVYILNEGPDGKITELYPQQGQDNFVNAMGSVFFPSRGAFEFDNQSGTEQLLVYLSPVKLANGLKGVAERKPDIVASSYTPADSRGGECKRPVQVVSKTADTKRAVDGPTQVASLDTGYAAKGISFSADAPANCAEVAPAVYDAPYAAKGVVFSDDSGPAVGKEAASYVVKKSPARDEGLYLKIRLNHQ